jgi:hypothetical protein
MPTLLAQPTWIVLDVGILILGGLCILVPLGIFVFGLTLLVRSGGRAWRPLLVVAIGCLLSWFLFPAVFDYQWIRTVFSLRIIVPATIGCLGIVCIVLGLRAMIQFQQPR